MSQKLRVLDLNAFFDTIDVLIHNLELFFEGLISLINKKRKEFLFLFWSGEREK